MKALSSLVPLRTSAVWDGYREAVPLPHRYGECSGALVQYDARRQVFVWADHPVQAIDQVLVDGQPAGNWEWSNALDATGRMVAFVRFAAAVPEGQSAIARGRGKLDPHTGNLLTNPAAFVLDVLTTFAGSGAVRADLEPFRRECEVAGLAIAGSIESDEQKIHDVIREACASVGAVFAPDALGLAFLWPGGATTAARTRIAPGVSLSASAKLADVVNDITIRFDFEGGEPRQSLQMEAPASIAALGRRSEVFDARWLKSARNATDVGTRLLQQRARPQWIASAGPIERAIAVGESVELAHPLLPISGTFRVLERRVDLAERTSIVTFTVPAGPVPSVRLVRQATRSEPQQYAAATVRSEAGTRAITVESAPNVPAPGAKVTLNGQITRIADGSGVVRFPNSVMPAGIHTLLLEKEGVQPLRFKVQVS